MTRRHDGDRLCEVVSGDGIQDAYGKNRLWPQIHAAVDVYLRRKASGADSYELIWRLVHVWESTAITLATISATRFKAVRLEPPYLAARSKMYGIRWNKVTSTLEQDSASCFTGSVDKWIELLRFVSDLEPTGDAVLDTVRAFLIKLGVDQRELATA